MKHLFVVFSLLASILTFAPAHAQDITGTWNVVCKPAPLTTGKAKSENFVYQWLIAVQDGGRTTITVLGQTNVGSMSGNYKDSTLIAEGPSKAPCQVCADAKKCPPLADDKLRRPVFSSAVVEFTAESATKMSGKRYFLALEERAELQNNQVLLRPVVYSFDCTATKQ